MKYALPIVAALVIGVASWMNVRIYVKEKERFAELRAQRCTCHQTNAVDTATSKLPPGAIIQKSTDGQFRWRHNHWTSIREYGTYEEAVESLLETQKRIAQDKTKWTDLHQ